MTNAATPPQGPAQPTAVLEHWIVGHDEPHRCSPQPATRDCAEALSVELALSGYTLLECKAWWISRRSARHYELRDSLGKLVTSITLGKSADKDCWKDLMRSSLSVPIILVRREE